MDPQTRRITEALRLIEQGEYDLARRLLAVVADRYRQAVAR